MCKIMDEIRQAGFEHGMERGMERGMKRGMERGMERGIKHGMERDRLESLRTIMQTMKLSEEEAMNALLIPLEKRAKYKALLAQ